MKYVLNYLRPFASRMIFGFIIKIFGTTMDLVIPWLLAYIVDNIIETEDINRVLLFGCLMILCAIIGVVSNIIANRMASYVAKGVTTDLRHDLFKKIQSLSFKQIDDITIPTLISRMSSDTYNVHQMIGMVQRIGVRAPILLIGGILVTLTLDPVLTCVLLATLPLIIITTYVITKIGIPLFTKVQLSLDKMVRVIRENADGARVIKALSKAEYEKKRFNTVNKEIFDYEIKSGYTMARLNPLINLFLNIGLVGVVICGAYRANSGLTDSGEIIAFTSYFTIILNAMLSITRIFIIFSRSYASAVRIQYVFDLVTDLDVISEEEIDSEYYLQFKDVCFSYNGAENNLENISFSLKKGESLGIIGATGSGKSTIINLLMRFYDVGSGDIIINNHNIKTIDNDELKKMFGVVFQNDSIFSTSVYDNISLHRNISREEVCKATEYAMAKDFIDELPQGLDTVLSAKGTNLSGGQKQRLLIARSLAGKPDILILDDASSALDYKTDAKLRKNIAEYFSMTTTIIVTQRISSISNCDHILVLDDGKVIGYGNHDQLLQDVAIYKEIYQSQMGGSINE